MRDKLNKRKIKKKLKQEEFSIWYKMQGNARLWRSEITMHKERIN